MAEASKVSGEKYRRIFLECDPVFAVRLEFFSKFPNFLSSAHGQPLLPVCLLR